MSARPPIPRPTGRATTFENALYAYLQGLESEISQPGPKVIQLEHQVASRLAKASQDGLVMYDPVKKKPVYSEGGVWLGLGEGFTVEGAITAPLPSVTMAGVNFDNMLITGRGLTMSPSAQILLSLSTDNGVTWLGSPRYVTISTAGAESAGSAPALHSALSVGPVSIIVHLLGLQSKCPVARLVSRGTDRLIDTPSGAPINAVRISASGTANITGGTIRMAKI